MKRLLLLLGVALAPGLHASAPHPSLLTVKFHDPMLPVVKGDEVAARAILANTILLVAASLSLALYSPGWFYLVFAVAGGGLFIRYNLRLVANPGRATAMASFHASLAQLSLVLAGLIIDAAMKG